MSIYALVAVGGTGLGPVAAGWIEMNPHLQWRWIQWIHMMSVFLSSLSHPIDKIGSFQSHGRRAPTSRHVYGRDPLDDSPGSPGSENAQTNGRP